MTEPHDYIDVEQLTWSVTIDDLAEDAIRVMQFASNGYVCDACHHLSPHGYLVWAQHPLRSSDDDGWHRWGRVCWTCMAAIVAAGGEPLYWTRSER
ncbi:hypothetical protein [Actinopolyspora halophila]|uniref:hypothetical protein n=1 Tax=Actinopolyspora halophila TaxID=1850 RepID=UPI000368AB46|nr:hypothetical protein [Actinopolyspora halophila]